MSASPAVAPSAPPPVKPIRGPSALGGEWRRFVYLSFTLAITDFKLRFFGSVLGYLWQLMRPLLLFGVLFLVFTKFVRVGGSVPHYPVLLLANIVLYSFVLDSTTGAVSSVVDRENLVRKIQFPRLAIPTSIVLTAWFNLALNLVVVAIFMFATGVHAGVQWLELPVILLFLTGFAFGLAMLLSALYVRFRDVAPIWDVVLQAMFYGSPIIYPLELIHPRWLQQAIAMTPLATALEQIRHALIDPTGPSAGSAVGGVTLLAVPLAIVLAILAVGFWYFNREAPRIAEEL